MQFSAAVLKTYRRRLTNLSSRNRSLLLSSLPADQFVDLHEADFRLAKPSFDLIAGLIGRKAVISICALTDPRDERTNTLSKRLRKLQRTDAFIEAERGTEDLYVGWPFVRGRFNDGTPVHGPLLFFPVHLATEGNSWRFVRRGDQNALINQSMLLAYGHFNGISLPDDWLTPDLDGFDKDPLIFRTQLYEWLKTSPFEINFNPNTFTDTLIPFDKQSAKALTELEAVGELKLIPEAVLGIFPQAGSFLVPDYDVLLQFPAHHPHSSEELSEVVPASSAEQAVGRGQPNGSGVDALLPLPVDASQERAVEVVRAGQSVVVQGPPGTGKSQLIANLMADAVARGQRVLLVCQKRAALDVVQQRLAGVGMAPFTALVHDFQDDRKALYAQLAEQIDAIDDYKTQNRSLDAVLLEREFTTETRRINGLVRELQTFKDALFDTTVCGLSAKELYLTSHPQVDPNAISLHDLYRNFRFDTSTSFREQLADYLAYRGPIGPAHPFADRVSFARFSGVDLASLRQTITEAAQALPTFATQAQALTGAYLSWPELLQLVPNRAVLDALAQTVSDPPVWSVLSRLAAGSIPDTPMAALATDTTALAQLEGRGLLVGTYTHELAEHLQRGINARQSVLKWLFYADKPYLNELAEANGLSTSLRDLQALESRRINRQAWEARAEETGQQFTGTSLVGPTPDATKQRLEALRSAVGQAEAAWQQIQASFPVLVAGLVQQPDGGSFGRILTGFRQLLDEVHLAHSRWTTYLSANQLTALAAAPSEQATTLLTALHTDADNLIEMDRLRDTFTTPERTVADRVSSVAAFDNALRLAWIDHLETLYPELRSVSSLKMAQLEEQLQRSLQQRQRLTRDILLLKLREHTYRDLVINRLNNVVSFRELRHQVTKRRNVWPVRQLMSHYADDVFRLLPCWMASPESVSALFPMQTGLFDLVIFDEASQCFAENGLPALLRGKQVLIAGDSKQLRPSDLYRARFDEANPEATADELIPLEVESLLDLTAQYLPQVTLMGHYRSRSLDLIAFANKHFYNDSLTLLPDFVEANRREPGIRYRQVAGQWEHNTNPIEADAVLTLVGQLQVELPDRSLGIVTFNFQQQQLIQDLWESQTPPLTPPLGGVRFIKNIENVQGDECDIIIFSIGYAPNERGRLSAQFGSLNAAGGENRLNVAVTRARERIYVITSLQPGALDVEATTNEGPKLLKAYLQYALDVSEGRFRPQPKPVAELRAGMLLKDRLTQTHPKWHPELPFADLTIQGDDARPYEGLVLTDDDQYYGQSVKEAHAYRPFALQERHWPYRRIWSREAWRMGS